MKCTILQKIFLCVPFYGYSGIVSNYVASADILSEVVKDRYGCRVIQLSIEVNFQISYI